MLILTVSKSADRYLPRKVFSNIFSNLTKPLSDQKIKTSAYGIRICTSVYRSSQSRVWSVFGFGVQQPTTHAYLQLVGRLEDTYSLSPSPEVVQSLTTTFIFMFILTHVSSSEWLSRGSQRSSAHQPRRFYTRGQTGKPTDKQIILAATTYLLVRVGMHKQFSLVHGT